jgi:hypothetical protein
MNDSPAGQEAGIFSLAYLSAEKCRMKLLIQN